MKTGVYASESDCIADLQKVILRMEAELRTCYESEGCREDEIEMQVGAMYE